MGLIAKKRGTPRPGNGGARLYRRPTKGALEDYRMMALSSTLRERLFAIAMGKPVEQTFLIDGKNVAYSIPASIKEQLKAIEMIQDRGLGKPTQGIELGPETQKKMVMIFPGVGGGEIKPS